MSALRLARGRLREERGFTLTEMLVALAIGTATLTVIMNLVVASHAASSRVVARVDGTQRGRVAMEQATQRLRSQVCLGSNAPIIAGNQDSVTFYADLGDEQFRPEKRRLFVSGSDLREQIWEGTGTPPSVTYPATPTRERVVLQDVEPVKEGAATLPYFSFYAYNSASPSQPDAPLSVPLSGASLPLTARVRVAFKAKSIGKEDERVDTNFVNAVTTRLGNPTDPDPTRRGPQCA